jgi:uncharacterized protein
VLDEVLLSIAERHPDDTPQWEFCEGFMTALLCMRRTVGDDEWLPELFQCDTSELFASESEHTRFLMAWMERESQLRDALEPQDEEEEGGLSPALIDWRGLAATLTEAERAQDEQHRAEQGLDAPPPALGQVWAMGFMSVLLSWPEDWMPPRDKEMARDMREALQAIAALEEDDTGAPASNLYDPSAPPSVSAARVQAVDEAIGAVYTLYDIAQALGPRVPSVRNLDKTGRNDPCPCGSGKKYKKCCGA